MTQAKFFHHHESTANLPEGMRYRSRLISRAEEKALLARVRELPFKEFEFHGYKGKRRTVSFGWQYEFSGRGRLQKATDIPEFILPLRAIAATFARIEPESLQHVLVIEYGPGAGIGWPRDKPVFGEVIGVSLLAPCVVRFRRKVSPENGREVTVNTSDAVRAGRVSDPVGKVNIGTGKIRAPKRDAVHPRALDRRLAFERHAEGGEEGNGGWEVVDDDADMVHSLDRHVP